LDKKFDSQKSDNWILNELKAEIPIVELKRKHEISDGAALS